MRRQQEKTVESLKCRDIKKQKHKGTEEQLNTVSKQIMKEGQEFQYIQVRNSQLQAEIESEISLIQDIQLIAQKYKKLLAEQRRDKEKLMMSVNNQRKIMQNLVGRKAILNEDASKLYDKFSDILGDF